ncbi:MAG: class I SAM-dependent methyltransferase [Chloroflexi bacterium]|nr:class I SAM-dependent methyltransferase [Chloroflexota bacterium]
MVETVDKRASLGHPSQIWTRGLERRLEMVRRAVPLEDRRILDVGCGVGAFARRLREFSQDVHGVDIDEERVRQGAAQVPNLALALSEYLPFADETFDVVLLHEVLEHVTDDLATLREVRRVLRREGRAVIFCPNRLYPFETHGVFLGRRYVFGNVPLVNWLPDAVRNRLVPHARAYTHADLQRTYRRAGLRERLHDYVFPGFDHVSARRKIVGKALRVALYPLERTPLRIFGLSHFVVLEKV